MAVISHCSVARDGKLFTGLRDEAKSSMKFTLLMLICSIKYCINSVYNTFASESVCVCIDA